MKITNARYEYGKLILETTDPEARRVPYDFKPGEYELVKAKKKRSLDANAYCWALCTQIADVVRVTKEEVYCRNIKEGGEYMTLTLKNDEISDLRRIWCSRGTGWVIEVVDDDSDDRKLVFAYYGSSVYDTAQMARLIDRIVQDAKSVGVEVLSDRELSLLIDDWDKKQ